MNFKKLYYRIINLRHATCTNCDWKDTYRTRFRIGPTPDIIHIVETRHVVRTVPGWRE